MSDYFSDRELGPKTQTEELISTKVWGGIFALVNGLIDQGAFGNDYPETCPDGFAVVGTNGSAFGLAVKAEIPGLAFPLQADSISDFEDSIQSRRSTLTALDFIEFCHRHVAEVERKNYHDFFSYYHLRFDPEAGQVAFRENINRIFACNRIALHLAEDGMIRRLLPIPARLIRNSDMPSSGEATLDNLINESLEKFSDTDHKVRKDALEKLWDAWERLKSIEEGNKKQSVSTLLARVAHGGPFDDLVQEEAQKLTNIGNDFQIRHTETDRAPLTDSKHIDYLYARLLSFVHLLLVARSKRVSQ